MITGVVLDSDVPQTWFETEANHDKRTRQLIVCNDPCRNVPQVHRIQWDCPRLDDRTSVGPSMRELFGSLKASDTLSMIPVKANPERQNWVGFVTVEVYCDVYRLYW